MVRSVLMAIAFLICPGPAFADAKQDCHTGSGEVAIRGCTELISRNPKDGGAHHIRGNAYCAKKDYDRAIADYNRAIELNPKIAILFTARGMAYMQKGDYDRTIADDSRAIELDPKSALTFNERANAYGGEERP